MSGCDCAYADEDGNPEPCFSTHQEEPDCSSCCDSGCPACEWHPERCDCKHCAESTITVFELNEDAEAAGLTIPNAWLVDEVPF